MAGYIELQMESGLIGNKVHIRNSNKEVWSTSSFVAYVEGNRASYDIAIAEDGSSCCYFAAFPATIPAGRYSVFAYDSSNGPLGSFTGNWDGSSWDAGWATPTRTLSAFAFSVDLSAGALSSIWSALTSAMTTVGSIGKLIKDYLDATISSRNATTPPTVTAIRQEMDSNSTKLANLDVATSTRLPTSSYTTPPTVVQTRQEMDANSTKLSNLDAAITTRLASGTVASDVTAIKAKTDNLPDGIAKNTALNNFEFLMLDSSDHSTSKTGLTVTAQRSIDGGAFASCANAVSEVGSGVYKINLAAGDLNGNVVTFVFTASGADARYVTVVPQS